MHGKMISNDRSEHLPRPPWRNSLQRRWQAPRACRSRPQRRRSRPGKIVGVRFRVRTNFDHGLQSATACGTWRRSSPKAARPSTRSTCGSMIRGYGRWARQPNTDVIAQWVHRRRGTGRRVDVLDPLASPSSPRRMGRAGASLRSPPDCRHPRRRDQTAPNQHCASPPFAQRGHRLLPTVATPFDDLAHRTGKPASLMPSAAGRQVPARHHFSRHRDRAIGLIRQASGWSLNTR